MNMCTGYMIDKLELEADFDNKLFNNPKELLKRKPLMKDAGTCMYFTGPISSLSTCHDVLCNRHITRCSSIKTAMAIVQGTTACAIFHNEATYSQLDHL